MPRSLSTKKTARERARDVVGDKVKSILDRPIGEPETPTSVLEGAYVQQTARRDPNNRIIHLELIDPDPNQPRTVETRGEDFEGLVLSIKEHGVISPITVRFKEDERRYQIITGERRFQAAKQIGLNEIPAIIRDVDDTKQAIEQIVENTQREDMNPVEEAVALNRLIEMTDMTHAELAAKVGKSRDYITKMLSLPKKLTTKEQARLRQCAPAHIPRKSLILEALRTEDEKTRVQILFGGLTRTEARKAVRKPTGGRPRLASKTFKAPDSAYTVIVRSKNTQMTDQEVFDALQVASMEQAKLLGNQDS